jgi:sterol desaturase/sphingolipid hydroxylase (fatty acid hydroxylase superfamily)
MTGQLNTIVHDLIRLSVWFVLLAAIFIPLERFIPRSPQPIIRKNYLEDCFYYFLNGILPKLLLVVPLSLLAAFIHHLGSNSFYAAVESLSVRKRLLLALVIGDFEAYWGHRWSHEIPFLWRFHSVHHSATEMDWLVNSRAHPFDMVFTRLSGLIPIYLLGFAQPTANTADIVPFVYMIFGNFWSFVIHANVNLRFGWFEKFLATPAFHHWHHTNEATPLMNKNYAAIFPIYDRLFGSHFLPKSRWPSSYGLAEAVPAASPEPAPIQ